MSEQAPLKIQPRMTAVSAPYWEGCANGELRLQRCADCGKHQFYPRVICSHCSGDVLTWEAVSGKGVIESFTVVRRGISRAYESPYAVALVRLAEGPVMMSSLVGAEPEQVRVGASVSVEFEDWGDGTHLPVFRLEAGAAI